MAHLVMAVDLAKLTAILASVPAALVVAYTEATLPQSVALYVAAGCVTAIVCESLVFRRFIGFDALALIFAAAGSIAGLVYWAIAGRTAGAWRAQ